MAFPPKYPEELFRIKCLLLRKQYNQCIKACFDVLGTCEGKLIEKHPLSEAFATFYLALAQDELGRSMSEQSSFKLPAFTQAEQHYRDAIKVLPTVEQCRSMLTRIGLESDITTNVLAQSSCSMSSTEPSADTIDLPSPSAPPAFKIADHNEDAPSSPQKSDVDSHDSFDDIMTPPRILKRDISCMSLLDQPLQRDYSSMSLLDVRPMLDRSVSQGLLRPIRPGSPPRQYHLPPKLPYSGQSRHHISVPRLRLSPPRRSSNLTAQPPKSIAQPSNAVSTQFLSQRTPSSGRKSHSIVDLQCSSSVSALGSEVLDIEHSFTPPVSPVSPPTRPDAACQPAPDRITTEIALDLQRPGSPVDLTWLAEHLSSMRTQIHTHITLLQRAKIATTVAQAERASRSIISTNARLNGDAFGESSTMANNMGRRIVQSRSFWSFTPVDIKAAERRKKIEEGRSRGWERTRYRSEKYVALAEKALAEL